MNDTNQLATIILKSTGLYSDEALARIENGRAENPEMGLAEAAVKFGGSREPDFLKKVGEFLGMDYIELENVQPRPDVLQKLPASPYTSTTSSRSSLRAGSSPSSPPTPSPPSPATAFVSPRAAPSRSPSRLERRSTRP